MHEKLIEVFFCRKFIFFLKRLISKNYCAKSSKAFVADKSLDGTSPCDENIDSEIKFVTINQEWIVNVSLDNHFLRKS